MMGSKLWKRLARLDRCCDVSISNTEPGSGWRAKVSTRTDRLESFEVSGATLLETVERLVAEAERRKWASS